MKNAVLGTYHPVDVSFAQELSKQLSVCGIKLYDINYPDKGYHDVPTQAVEQIAASAFPIFLISSDFMSFDRKNYYDEIHFWETMDKLTIEQINKGICVVIRPCDVHSVEDVQRQIRYFKKGDIHPNVYVPSIVKPIGKYNDRDEAWMEFVKYILPMFGK